MKKDFFIEVGEHVLTEEEFKKQIADILDGKYSLTL